VTVTHAHSLTLVHTAHPFVLPCLSRATYAQYASQSTDGRGVQVTANGVAAEDDVPVIALCSGTAQCTIFLFLSLLSLSVSLDLANHSNE
jgi:hypothetical protein